MHEMSKRAELCAGVIKEQKKALIVSHIDADGLTSAAITCKALERAGMESEVKFLKQLDLSALEDIANQGIDLVIFTDLGSGIAGTISEYQFTPVIVDHHQVNGVAKYHLNPHLFGINGSYELSGAGAAFILAQALGENKDLADLAIVGAVGDLQARRDGKLAGMNREILKIGEEAGVLHSEKDVTFFGKQTRPIYMLLQYSNDPYIPGITGNEQASVGFLRRIGIELKRGDWRRWIDLSLEEKQKIVSNLIQHCLSKGVSQQGIGRLVGEVYTLVREEEGLEMRDASEYSTLLNATARYDFSDVGLAVCMGDRDDAYKRARSLLLEHRRNLVQGLELVKSLGVTTLDNIQYFYAGDKIRETIVGIIAGMSMSVYSKSVPIIGIVDAEDGIKVSSRGTQNLVRRGLNLGVAISESAAIVGGIGGGHDIAAGATIPKESMDEFISLFNEKIGMQIG
ncbi:MAG: DHH family phosphoesterase [Halobacteriota archaeon]|nr:DHH family phosphoesterase [Halobacteriota archaeon]